MIHNNKVYANADEKYVKATIVYGNDSNLLYHDVECTKPVLTTEVRDMFFNGLIVSLYDGDELYVPYGTQGTNVLIREITGFSSYGTTEPEVETEE